MKHTIKNWSGQTLFACEAESLKAAVENAVADGASLDGARLDGASLDGARLDGASLDGAILDGASLVRARLVRASLDGASLVRARLDGARLDGARLDGASLDKTLLDPKNAPNGHCAEFIEDAGDGWVFGYRTRETRAAGKMLADDRIYGCEVFSTGTAECHPGWYLWPTITEVDDYSRNSEKIKVKARRIDIHKAGGKWRARSIWVIGSVEVNRGGK